MLAGQQERGLRALDGPLGCIEEVWWLPEQYRLRAKLLLLSPGNETEAEAGLRQAMDVAREQGCRSLELRAAMNLARLLRGQRRAREGEGLLAERFDRFTEGWDTADLREARALLTVLQTDDRSSRSTQVPALRVALALGSPGPLPQRTDI